MSWPTESQERVLCEVLLKENVMCVIYKYKPLYIQHELVKITIEDQDQVKHGEGTKEKENGQILVMVINKQFQQFIDSKFTLDYDSQMTDKYFVKYTGIKVQHFRDTLLQHLGNVKKSVVERIRHQRQYEIRVNKGHMQTQESKIDTGKAVENGLVVMERNGTESKVKITLSSGSDNK
ncbi:hypothetical protein Tco_0256687 [Tanacetum coccineum]